MFITNMDYYGVINRKLLESVHPVHSLTIKPLTSSQVETIEFTHGQ
jgi:hypothetical protein